MSLTFDQFLLGCGAVCWVKLGFAIFQEYKSLQETEKKYKKLSQYHTPIQVSDLRNQVDQMQNRFKNKDKLQFEYYANNEIVLKNMYILGRTHTDFPIQPQNKKHNWKLLIYSKNSIKNQASLLNKKEIETQHHIAPSLKLQDRGEQINLTFDQNVEINKDRFDYRDTRQLKKFLKPWNMFQVHFVYSEIGISMGGFLSVFGDVIYNLKDKSLRMENAKYFGYSYQELLEELLAEKIERNLALIILVTTFAISGYIFIGDILKGLFSFKEKITKKLHNLKQVKYSLNSIYCKICKKNLKNVFYQPCLHLEICEDCSQEQKVKQCQTCKQAIKDRYFIFLS